jgi:DNA primase
MSALLDIETIRRTYPLPPIVAASVKLSRAGSEFKACCPFHADKSPSFTIFGNGLRWKCFGCGASGDVLDYIRRLHGIGLRAAADMLTGGQLPSVYVAPAPTVPNVDRVAEAKAIWHSAQPITGTLAETYLRWRCIHTHLPDSLSFARLPYGKRGPNYPCLVAAVGSADNKLVGIQRTYLAADGKGKADVPEAKLSLGRVSGCAIRLAPCAATLIICEGLEDGLTLQQELGRAVWVAAGSSMLPNMIFPAGVRQVAIGGDADEAGRIAARKAVETFTHRKIRARAFFPIDAKDFNAELMERIAA